MRRLALFSDIHGNIEALDAVLADIERCGIEERYCLGDLVGYGPDPGRVVERVRALGIPTVQGNYDKGVGGLLGDCGCYYATEQARADGEVSYQFTTGALTAGDRAWLFTLPEDIRLEHLGVRVLLCHGSPRKNNEYLLPDRTDEQLLRLARQAEADVVCVGHTHGAYHRRIDDEGGAVHYLNSGSVGKPKDGDPRAGWLEVAIGTEDEVRSAILGDAARGPAGLTHVWVGALIRRVEYDVEAVARRMVERGLPVTLAEALRNA